VSDVRDVVRAYRLLVELGEPGEAYNVCTGRGVTVAEVADRLIRLSGRELRVVVASELVRPIDVPNLIGDPAKLQAATGWEPAVTLDTTLKEVLHGARTAP
jgi:GDP-4-dehydro-6-deoxy-D-mannose reductase